MGQAATFDAFDRNSFIIIQQVLFGFQSGWSNGPEMPVVLMSLVPANLVTNNV